MKVLILSALLPVVSSAISFGIVISDQLTPKNIAEQPFRFTIVSGNEGGRATFTITVEAKDGNRFPDTVDVLLSLVDGKKRIADVPVATVKKDHGITASTFYVHPEYLKQSMFEFDVFSVFNGVAMPGGSSFWFYLKDFADRK